MNVLSSASTLIGGNRFKLTGHSSSGGHLGLGTDDIVRVGPRRSSAQPAPGNLTFEERIFAALAEAKIWTSRVAMHMELDERNRYFRQLDLLHDPDEWFGEENPVVLGSYQSFIRFMLTLSGGSKPSLGLTPSGLVVAAWQQGRSRLTVEFGVDNRVEWVVSRFIDQEFDRAAGTTNIERLLSNLAPYDPADWGIN